MSFLRTVQITALALAVAPALRAATHNVTVGPDTAFHPQTITINVGDTVVWTGEGGFHNVRADDGSFSHPGGSNFTFSHTFDASGTAGYHCTFHGAPRSGMFGTVIVQGGGGEQAGILRFGVAFYTVGEGGGSAVISVERIGGDDGAVSAQYSAAAGTATPGQDFLAVTGTLSWADNDDAPKSFTVPVTNDSATEANETILLALANPTGGAVLDASGKTATLTILDNDSFPGSTPAAPGNLQAVAQSATEIVLTWTDNSSNETGFRVERRTIGGAFAEVGTVGPSSTGTVSAVIGGLDPSTFYLFRVRALGGGSVSSGPSNEAGVATFGNVVPCVVGAETLCLNNGRFRAEVDWRIPDGTSGAGQAVPLAFAPDSGLFYFFSSSNIELLVKVLNACDPPFNRYWVFFSATTNVEFAVVVTDTQTGRTRSYYNPLNRSAPPVQDVNAFATCP